jgi:hypothetical protein
MRKVGTHKDSSVAAKSRSQVDETSSQQDGKQKQLLIRGAPWRHGVSLLFIAHKISLSMHHHFKNTSKGGKSSTMYMES